MSARTAARRRLNGPRRRALKRTLAERDGAWCTYCGHLFADLKRATVDHVVPLSLFDTWRPDHLVLACRPCNWRKADRLPLLLALLLAASASALSTPVFTSGAVSAGVNACCLPLLSWGDDDPGASTGHAVSVTSPSPSTGPHPGTSGVTRVVTQVRARAVSSPSSTPVTASSTPVTASSTHSPTTGTPVTASSTHSPTTGTPVTASGAAVHGLSGGVLTLGVWVLLARLAAAYESAARPAEPADRPHDQLRPDLGEHYLVRTGQQHREHPTGSVNESVPVTLPVRTDRPDPTTGPGRLREAA